MAWGKEDYPVEWNPNPYAMKMRCDTCAHIEIAADLNARIAELKEVAQGLVREVAQLRERAESAEAALAAARRESAEAFTNWWAEQISANNPWKTVQLAIFATVQFMYEKFRAALRGGEEG